MNITARLLMMKEDYEERTGEKPAVMLVDPETYIEIREDLINTSWWRHMAKIKEEPDKINFLFGIPVEISTSILPKAIFMNKEDYIKYCDWKFMNKYEFKFKEEE